MDNQEFKFNLVDILDNLNRITNQVFKLLPLREEQYYLIIKKNCFH